MAFDQTTRNRLQKFVSESRGILTEEFTRQLQAIYGLDPRTGTTVPVDTLNFLDNKGRQTAVMLRQTLTHYAAAITGKSEKVRTQQALDRIIREQAFTVLNRLAALRMAEARGFLIESVSKGYSSKGFQLYKTIAGTGLGETGDAYSAYLFSIFDEFSLDLAVLFDRHSIQGRLFPRESALLALLDQISHFEIEHLWAEDETIGWIYQYFNTQEERKTMRAESQAPRNSRELAVRNQFFTPRYVVEFLTDNTLGRIWYEMTQGKAALVDTCRYLVRRPTEIFLTKGEAGPEENDEDQESLSQEELLKQPVYIPFRQLKDPREIRMLDPACGSMHFGLYAFDLFEKIYGEAWQLETDLGPDIFERSKELLSLQASYASFEEFQKVVPKLIIEQNIHGVDIDPRAVQIAGLSLWQRAQRAWHQLGIKPNQRPNIKKSNIVCAEPMPGEKELLLEFTARLNPPMLGQLVETIFDKMELAGEAGTLLKIEEEIKAAISQAKEAFNTEILHRKEGKGFLPGMAPKREPTLFDFADLHGDTDFWETAEERILDALRDYADQAESDEGQKRLFAEDAAKGFAFIDLCRKRFDVVLMNPPFGEPSNKSSNYLKLFYPTSKSDLLAAFVERGLLKIDSGYLGSITARTAFYLITLADWRDKILQTSKPEVFADIGFGVMDDALVDAAAYCLNKTRFEVNDTRESIFIRLLDSKEKETALKEAIKCLIDAKNHKSIFMPKIKAISSIPEKPFAYWAKPKLLETFRSGQTFINSAVERDSKCGLGTLDDFRFLRLRWEVLDYTLWRTYISGGSYSPYIEDLPIVVNWYKDGKEIKVFVARKVGSASRKVQSESLYFIPGFTFPRRTRGFSPKLMPENSIFSTAGQAGFAAVADLPWVIPMMSSIVTAYLISLSQGSSAKGGGSSPQFEVGLVKRLPWVEPNEDAKAELSELFFDTCRQKIKLQGLIENSEWFVGWSDYIAISNIKVESESICKKLAKIRIRIRKNKDRVNTIISNLYGLSNNWQDLAEELADSISEEEFSDYFLDGFVDSFKADQKFIAKNLLSIAFGQVFCRFPDNPSKSSFLFERDNFLLNRSSMALQKQSDDIRSSSKSIINVDNEVIPGIRSLIDDSVIQSIEEALEIISVNKYFESSNGFFDYHLKLYSSNRRQAPIYWPLQTQSGSYTLWVYYHRLTDQTLYTCVNDFVEPKLKTVTGDLNTLRNKSARSSAEEKELTSLSDLEAELKDFQDELLRIAKFWKPNLNDGVQITAAPLWKLFQHRQWQKKLKETWEKLDQGEYDWAHLAYSIWSKRVLGKCHEDRSLAIAHDVEADFWEEIEVAVIRRGKDTGKSKMEWHPRPLTQIQLHELIQQKIKDMKPSH